MRLLPAEGLVARELGVSHCGLISPEWTTPGGHHRWDADKVRRELRDQRQRDPE
jgi:hypothetical protein